MDQKKNLFEATYKVLSTFLKQKIGNFVMYKASTKNDNFLHIPLEGQNMGKTNCSKWVSEKFPHPAREGYFAPKHTS